MAPARRLAGRVYAAYLDAVNQRFTDLVEASGAWSPEGVPGVRDLGEGLWSRPEKTRDRRAVIIVDAFRLDIAQRLTERLARAELHGLAATLPTTTPFGMTALLPTAGEPISVVAGKGTLSLCIGSSTGLEGRPGRIAHLKRVFAERGDTIAFVELETMLQGEPVPDARFVVAFTYALDDQGHSVADTASLPDEAVRLPGRLARVIERFHAAGIGRVDVVTDHGFLWLNPEDVDALGTPAIPPPAQVVNKTGRYVLLEPGAAATELLCLPLPFEPALELGFPRGLRTLGKAAWYSHGGISLQEAIIPHVVSRTAPAVSRVKASFVVPIRELVGATIPVRVAPVVAAADGEQLSLQGPPPLRVRLEVLTTGAEGLLAVTAPVHLDVRTDSPEQRTALYLSEDVKLAAGTELKVAAFDDETGESLFEHRLTLVTDWE